MTTTRADLEAATWVGGKTLVANPSKETMMLSDIRAWETTPLEQLATFLDEERCHTAESDTDTQNCVIILARRLAAIETTLMNVLLHVADLELRLGHTECDFATAESHARELESRLAAAEKTIQVSLDNHMPFPNPNWVPSGAVVAKVDVLAKLDVIQNLAQAALAAVQVLTERLVAVEEAQDFTANRLGELDVHEHMEVENRLTAVEEAQKTQEGWNGVTTTGILALIKRLEAAEAGVQRLAHFGDDLNINLEDAVARVIALEKRMSMAARVERIASDAVWQGEH